MHERDGLRLQIRTEHRCFVRVIVLTVAHTAPHQSYVKCAVIFVIFYRACSNRRPPSDRTVSWCPPYTASPRARRTRSKECPLRVASAARPPRTYRYSDMTRISGELELCTIDLIFIATIRFLTIGYRYNVLFNVCAQFIRI